MSLFAVKSPSPPQVRARKFIGTLNNPDLTMVEEFLRAWFTTGKAIYVTGQLEKGNIEGTLHV